MISFVKTHQFFHFPRGNLSACWSWKVVRFRGKPKGVWLSGAERVDDNDGSGAIGLY